MGTAIPLRNVIGKTKHLFTIAIIPLHGNFHGNIVLCSHGVKNIRMKHRFGTVDIFDKIPNAADKSEFFILAGALIDQVDFYAIVEKRKFAQALGKNIIVVFDIAKNFLTGQKVHFRAVALAFSGCFQWFYRNSHAKFHLVNFSIAANGQFQPFG